MKDWEKARHTSSESDTLLHSCVQTATLEPIRSIDACGHRLHEAPSSTAALHKRNRCSGLVKATRLEQMLTGRILSTRLWSLHVEYYTSEPAGPGYGPTYFTCNCPWAMGSELHQDLFAPELPQRDRGISIVAQSQRSNCQQHLGFLAAISALSDPSLTRKSCLDRFLLFSPTFCSPGVSYTGIPVSLLCLLRAGPTRNLGKAARLARTERFVATNTSLSGQRLFASSSFFCF